MNTRCRWVTVGCAVAILGFAYKFMPTGLSKDERRVFSHFTQANTQENHLTLNSTNNIRLVSYNLWCDYLKPHSITSLNDRIEGLAEGIKDFDIALIQEAYVFKTGIAVFTKCASLLIAMMETRGFHYRTSIADFVAPYLGQSGGIVIFSRIPLARTTSRRYRNYSILQFYNYRGFVVGEYLFNSRHLYVVNTHLDPHGAATRTLQVKELAAELVPSTPSMGNAYSHVVVGGDFNIDNHYPTTSNSSGEYKELLRTMDQAGLRSVFPVRMETSIEGGNYDAIFTSSDVTVVKKEIIKLVTKSNQSVSDHFGLAVELKLL